MKVVLVVPVRGKNRWNGCVHWATDIAECIRFAFAGCVECELLEVNLDHLATVPRAPVDLAVHLEKAKVDIFHTHNMYLALEPHSLESLLAHLSQSKLK